MYKSKFDLEGLVNSSFEGWTDGSTWNGWATPHFEFDSATRIVEEFNRLESIPNEKAWYDTANDQFCFVMEGELEPECYPSEMLEIDGREVKTYPIGTREWIWDNRAKE